MPRRILPLLLTIFAHLMLLQLISRERVIPSEPINIVPVMLHEAPVIAKIAAAPPPKARLQKKAQPPSQKKNAPALLSTPLSNEFSSPEPAVLALPIAPINNDDTPVVPAKIPTQTAPALLTTLPPSARYLLDVVRTEPKVANPYYGTGEVHWQHDNNHYTLHINVGVDLLFTTLNLYNIQSEGTVGDKGIQPRMVTEKRRGRSATATHFNYDSNTISFSASTALIPLSDGAQDKATVLMQLAGIGNASPTQFQPGKEITIQVAEEKEAGFYQFVVLDQETVNTKSGDFMAWHIVRPPRPGSYSSRLDMWLAPELGWLPVQIRNTEVNGAITTQTIRKMITQTE